MPTLTAPVEVPAPQRRREGAREEFSRRSEDVGVISYSSADGSDDPYCHRLLGNPPFRYTSCGVRLREPLPIERTHVVLSDREHRAAENAAGRPLASAILGSDRPDRARLHRPDFALVAGERVVAIELELTLKTKVRLERILRGYLRNRNLASVRYYTPPQIGEAVQRAARAAGADRLLKIVPLPLTTTSTIRTFDGRYHPTA